MENNQKFYGWKLVGALWYIYFLNMGFPLYGGAVINTYMMKEITMDRSVYGMGFTLLNFFVGVPSVLIASTMVKWGIKVTFGIGSALILIGSLWMALFASQPWHYLVGFGVIIGSGIGFGTIVPLSTAVTRWFKQYRGRAMALTMTASSFSGFICAPMMNNILEANGGNWRQTWLMVTGIAIVAAIIAYLFVKEKPEDMGQVVDGIYEESAIVEGGQDNYLASQLTWTPGEAYKTRAFWMIVVSSFACQYPFFFFTAHWIMHLRGVGINSTDAALAMGLFTMGGVAGRLIGGWLIDKMPARFVFMLGICCYFVGSFLAINLTANTLMMAFWAAILYGTGFGWSFVCLNTMIGNYFGSVAFPKVNGMVLLLSAIVCSPSGLIGGKMFDLAKSYTPAFYLNVAICFIGIIALLFATIPQKAKINN
jgi:MFS family permease